MIINPYAFASAPPPAAVTLNPADKAANLTLSGGNLIATSVGGAASYVSARATTSKTTGKFYLEFTVNVRSSNQIVGIANSAASLTNYFGVDGNGIGWATGTGAVLRFGSYVATVTTVAVAGIGCVAIDRPNDMMWFRTGSGNWNNDPSADPSTNVGGIAVPSGLAGGVAAFAGVSLRDTSDQVTVNYGATAFAHSVPSGFTAYGP